MTSQKNSSFVVILAGGEGTRFRPYSTPDKPKQFLEITSLTRTMLQETWERARLLVPSECIFVSTNERYVSLASEQLPHLSLDRVIGEPLKKNTAPAIALINHLIWQENPKASLLFLPADHHVHDVQKASQILSNGLTKVRHEEILLTFGVPPTMASSDYGYLELTEPIDKNDSVEPIQVKRFVEKPDLVMAQYYLEQKNFWWNAGIFAWNVAVFEEELRQHQPDLFYLTQQKKLSFKNQSSWFDYFDQAQEISIDYAVMEKSQRVKSLAFEVGWSDVGTWEGLKQVKERWGLTLKPEVEKHLRVQTHDKR